MISLFVFGVLAHWWVWIFCRSWVSIPTTLLRCRTGGSVISHLRHLSWPELSTHTRSGVTYLLPRMVLWASGTSVFATLCSALLQLNSNFCFPRQAIDRLPNSPGSFLLFFSSGKVIWKIFRLFFPPNRHKAFKINILFSDKRNKPCLSSKKLENTEKHQAKEK